MTESIRGKTFVTSYGMEKVKVEGFAKQILENLNDRLSTNSLDIDRDELVVTAYRGCNMKWLSGFRLHKSRLIVTIGILSLIFVAMFIGLRQQTYAKLRQIIVAARTASGDQAMSRLEQPVHATAILKGHADIVNHAVFSADGTRILTASNDKTARLWNAKTGKLLAELKGHTDWVNNAAFSPDGTRIVTASLDGTARLWDGKTGKLVVVMKGHTSSVSDAAFAPDGTRIVTASDDHTARLWDGKTGECLAELKGHTEEVSSAVFSPDGTDIVTAGRDNTARLWRTPLQSTH